MPWPSLSLVIFAYNEAENVGPTLQEALDWLRRSVEDWELLVVDDGSSDGTADAARAAARAACSEAEAPRVRVLSYRPNRGIGGALQVGFGAATRDWLTMIPADGQIAPSELDALLTAAAADSGVGLVTCHFPDRFREADGRDRQLLSEGLKAVMWLSTGVGRRLDGVYLLRRSLLPVADARSESFFFNFELPIRLLRAGVQAAEVTVHVRPRRAGTSKVKNLRTIARVGRELVRLGVALRLGVGR